MKIKRGAPEDLVGDRIRVAVKLFVLLQQPVREDLVAVACDLDQHRNPRYVRSRIRGVARQVVRHWQGEEE